MKCSQYYSKLLAQIKSRQDVVAAQYKLNYKKGNFPFWRVQSAKISPNDKVILLAAGIHGEEVAGPLTFYYHLAEIIDIIHQNCLKFILYPLRNPSGFENGLRYNIDNDKGNAGNNDFIRYELKNGQLVDDLKDKNEFKKWFWASDKRLKVKLPKETILIHRLLKADFKKHKIVACLDLHQDFITPKARPTAYHYAFGNTNIYLPIINQIEKIVPIWKNQYLGAGFHATINAEGKVNQKVAKAELIKSDKLGFIKRHDGSFGDLADRLGAKYNVTTETTGATPLKKAIKVNMIWIKGLVDLISNYSND